VTVTARVDLVATGGTNPASSPVMLAPIIITVETKKKRSYEDVRNMENRRDSIRIAAKKKKNYPCSIFPKSRRSLTEPSMVFVLRETEKGKMRVS